MKNQKSRKHKEIVDGQKPCQVYDKKHLGDGTVDGEKQLMYM